MPVKSSGITAPAASLTAFSTAAGPTRRSTTPWRPVGLPSPTGSTRPVKSSGITSMAPPTTFMAFSTAAGLTQPSTTPSPRVDLRRALSPPASIMPVTLSGITPTAPASLTALKLRRRRRRHLRDAAIPDEPEPLRQLWQPAGLDVLQRVPDREDQHERRRRLDPGVRL